VLNISFEGWFQFRMATDPDPPDEPRGISGPTMAIAGEPDLDGIIRFNDFVAPRYPMNTARGVTVTAVKIAGESGGTPHPLVGGRVDLLGKPMFVGRNFAVAVGGKEPIDPFHIQVSSPDGSIVISRVDLWDPAHPDLTALEITIQQLARRQPTGISIQNAQVAEATGVLDYAGFRQERRAVLIEKLKTTSDPIERVGLEQRIEAIGQDKLMRGVTIATLAFLGAQESFSIGPNLAMIGPGINGPITIHDPANRLGGKIGTAQPWPCDFWLGGFDVDTMMGYVQGSLSIPFKPSAS
jgi:hypothetical protein